MFLILFQFQKNKNQINKEMIQEDIDKTIRFFKLFSIHGELIWKIKINKKVKEFFAGVMQRPPQNDNELQSFQCEAEDLGYAIEKNELKTLSALLLISKREKCRKCFNKLEQKLKESKVTMYTREGTKHGAHFSKFCRKCNIYEYYGYYSKDGCKLVDGDDTCNVYLITSDCTGFEKKFLEEFLWEFVIGKMSFQTKSNIYNKVFQKEARYLYYMLYVVRPKKA